VEDEVNHNSFPGAFVTWAMDCFILRKALPAQIHIYRTSLPMFRNHDFATVNRKATSSQGKQSSNEIHLSFICLADIGQPLCSLQWLSSRLLFHSLMSYSPRS
jgi:hypothetical protein